MSAGLFSSLAISSSVATSILMGSAPPPAPVIPSQDIHHTEQSHLWSDHSTLPASTDENADKVDTYAKKWTFSPSSKASRDMSSLLTGDESLLSTYSSPQGVNILLINMLPVPMTSMFVMLSKKVA